MGLLLRAVEVAGPHRWRWLLVDESSGAPLADHQVELDPGSAEVEAFADLYRFLRWRADPDRRVASEAELLGRMGAWIGSVALGEQIGRAMVSAAPVTVRDESVLLARELPNLRALLHNEAEPSQGPGAADPALGRRVLTLVQGHPKPRHGTPRSSCTPSPRGPPRPPRRCPPRPGYCYKPYAGSRRPTATRPPSRETGLICGGAWTSLATHHP